MLKAITLETQLIKLEPMKLSHLDAFCLAGNFEQVWQYMPINRCKNKAVALPWITQAIDEMAQEQQLAFVTIDKKTNTVAKTCI